MAKSLCKYRRVEIADQFAKISRLVSEPRYVCSSCARAASDKAYLCKPSALKVSAEAKAKEMAAPCQSVPLAPLGGGEAAMFPVQAATKKQAKQLKKLAKKKSKRLKKATKAVQRYEKALKKMNQSLSS